MNNLTYEDMVNFANFLIGPALVYAGWTLHDLKKALNDLSRRQELLEKDVIKLQTLQAARAEQRVEDKEDTRQHFERLEKAVDKLADVLDNFIKEVHAKQPD